MAYRLICLSLINSCFLGFSYFAKGGVIEELATELSSSQITKNPLEFKTVEEKDLHFDKDIRSLANGNFHMSAKVISKDDLQRQYQEFDFDRISNLINSKKDRILIAKSAIVLFNVMPEYFTASRVLEPDFLSAAMEDSTNELLVTPSQSIRQTTNYAAGLVSIQSTIHFDDFCPKKLSPKCKYLKAANDFSKFSPGVLPDHVYTNYSGPREISRASYGGRSFHLFYKINENSTLYVSYKFITMRYESLFYFHWQTILNAASSGLIEGTAKSLLNIRKHIDNN